MTTPNNGSQASWTPDLPLVRREAPTAPEVPPPEAVPAGNHSVLLNLAERTRREHTERLNRDLLVGADYLMKERVRHPDGGDCSVEEIMQYEQLQRAEIDEDRASGSDRHGRLPRWQRRIPMFVLAFNFCLLLYFFAGVTRVSWMSPLSVALAFAAVLAAMVTVLSYGFLAFTGHRLRSHKNDAGTIYWADLDGFTQAASGIAVVVIAVVATLMFLRMRTEVLYALGVQAQLTALTIAVTVATVTTVANFLVIAVHGLDGSDEVARLEKLSATIRRHVTRAHRMREQAAAGRPVTRTTPARNTAKARGRVVPGLQQGRRAARAHPPST